MTRPSEPVAKAFRVWTLSAWDRSDDEPKVPCWGGEHFADTWFMGCPHQPTRREFIEAARAKCDETGSDSNVLEVIAVTYFRGWALEDRRHIEQWPLALMVLAGLRDAGYEVVRRSVPSAPASVDDAANLRRDDTQLTGGSTPQPDSASVHSAPQGQVR